MKVKEYRNIWMVIGAFLCLIGLHSYKKEWGCCVYCGEKFKEDK